MCGRTDIEIERAERGDHEVIGQTQVHTGAVQESPAEIGFQEIGAAEGVLIRNLSSTAIRRPMAFGCAEATAAKQSAAATIAINFFILR